MVSTVWWGGGRHFWRQVRIHMVREAGHVAGNAPIVRVSRGI